MVEILGGQNGSLRTLDTGPADTERDKKWILPVFFSFHYSNKTLSYVLATELHGHLDDLSSSLTQLIESVNTVSLGSETAKPSSGEDPMSQIAQVLSSHLESLQWIDNASRDLEIKMTEVEKRVKDAGVTPNGYSSPSMTGNGSRSRGFGLNR